MAGNPIVQYVIVRGDLISKLSWPLGAIVAQACHACTSVVHMFYKDHLTQQYLGDLDRMHKIILEVQCFKWICYLSHAGVRGDNRVDTLAARALIAADIGFSRMDLIKAVINPGKKRQRISMYRD